MKNLIVYNNQDDNWKSEKINGKITDIPCDWLKTKVNKKFKCLNLKGEKKGLKPYLEIGDIDRTSKKYSLKDKCTVKGAKLVDKNTLLISTVRPNLEKISITKEKLYVSSAFAMIKLETNYMYYIVTQKLYTDFLLRRVEGGNYPTVKKSTIYESEISIPKSNIEQTNIATILTTQESLISNITSRLLAQDKLIKYFRQELLSGRLRMRLTKKSIKELVKKGILSNEGSKDTVEEKQKDLDLFLSTDFDSKIEFYLNDDNNWKSEKINGKITDIPCDWLKTKVNKKFKCLNLKGEKKGLKPYLEIGDIDRTSKKYSLKDKCTVKGAKLVDKNTLLISTVRPNLEKISITKEKLYVSSAFAMIKLETNYMYYIVTQKLYTDFLLRRVEGGNYPTVKKSTIYESEISIPKSNIEQTNIATLLTNLDNAKESLNYQLEKEKRIFKVLSQELLAGRIRIKEK